jgi:hypothetical protein
MWGKEKLALFLCPALLMVTSCYRSTAHIAGDGADARTGVDARADSSFDTPSDSARDSWDIEVDTVTDPGIDPDYEPPDACSLFTHEIIWDRCMVTDMYTREPFYNVGSGPLMHMIGVYEGSDEETLTIRVGPTYRPVVLVLTAYDPVEWIIERDPGAVVQQVLVYGHHEQSVSGVPDVTVINRSLDPEAPYSHFCWPRCSECDPAPIVADAESLTGLELATFDGCYNAEEISLVHVCRDDCLAETACEGWECGWHEGCSVSCGTCPSDLACVDHDCIFCEPDCRERVCGSDGCAGSCGACPEDEICGSGGTCVTAPYLVMCDHVVSQSHYCLTMMGDSAAFIGLDTGEVCALDKWVGRYPGGHSTHSIALLDGHVHVCVDEIGAHGIVRFDLISGTWDVAPVLCEAVTRWRDGLLTMPPGSWGLSGRVLWFRSWEAALAEDGVSVPVDPHDLRMSASGDRLYSWWHSTDHVTEYDLVSGDELRDIYLEGYDDWINGLSVTEDGLIIINDRSRGGLSLYDVDTGSFIENVPIVSPPPDFSMSGLVCLEGT